jgi:glucose-6-phosphate 1-dehydrogenase
MEVPVSLDADAIRDEKVKVLRALRPVEPSEVPDVTVRGQYGAGVSDDDRRVPAYREEDGVDPRSTTETYVAHELYVDNWRWAGVPFFLRAGKRLPKRVTEIALQLRDVPHRLFRLGNGGRPAPNWVILRIQPDEGITFRFDAKRPGTEPKIEPVAMHMFYDEEFGAAPPEAYERLLLDAILGESTLFLRRDEVECAWAYVDRLLEGFREQGASDLPEYTAGTWGPGEADVLVARRGRTWRRPR